MSRAASPNKLREFRTAKSWTGEELAKKSGVAVRTIVSIESAIECRMDTKRKLLLALGIPFEQGFEVWPKMSDPKRGSQE